METEAVPQPKSETTFVYQQPGPKFIDLARDGKDRNNKLTSTIKNDETDWKPVGRVFTEREGLTNLELYLNNVQIELDKLPTPEAGVLKKTIEVFRENLVFVGENELRTALNGMANHVIELAREGNLVYLYSYGPRSERYVTLRVLEQVDTLLEENPELKAKIKFSENEARIFEHWGDGITNPKILIPDDFLVSGTTIVGKMGRINTFFKSKGIENPESFIEALLVTSPKRSGDQLKRNLKDGSIFSYYGIDLFKSVGGVSLRTGMSVTGSHASTDYAFEDEIEYIQNFLKNNRLQVPELPFLYKVDRPYEMKEWGQPREYVDENLQQRWIKIQQKFGIKL